MSASAISTAGLPIVAICDRQVNVFVTQRVISARAMRLRDLRGPSRPLGLNDVAA